MVAIIAIVVVLIALAIGAGIVSRRRAQERERVERERAVIASELSGHRQEAAEHEQAEGRFIRARDAADRQG